MRTIRVMLLLGVLAVLLSVAPAGAAGSITNLGKPTNDLPGFVALGGFSHRGPNLRRYGLPELLFLGTQIDGRSATERWAVVKALDQFGTLSGVRQSSSVACPGQRCNAPDIFAYPTFDWSRAHYRSRYLYFEHKDLLNRADRVYQRLNSQELGLFGRYVATPKTSYAATVVATAHNQKLNGSRFFPLISIGGYLQTDVDLLTPGDFVAYAVTPTAPTSLFTSNSVLSFATVHDALLHDTLTPASSRPLIPDINIEANVITALICHADGNKPKTVCGRAVIRNIMRHAR